MSFVRLSMPAGFPNNGTPSLGRGRQDRRTTSRVKSPRR